MKGLSNMIMRAARRAGLLVAAVLLLNAMPAAAQIAPERTLEELKTDTLLRAERQMYPLVGLKLDDVREALAHINSMDREEWGKAWLAIGDRYVETARAASGPAARESYRQAFVYYSVARFPIANVPSKKLAYERAVEAYLKFAEFEPLKLQVVRIPFEDKEIVGYLRLPETAGPAPLLIAWGGLDFLKEQTAEQTLSYVRRGIATFTLDIPGTGQAPIKASVTADRMFSRVLDYFQTRPEIDAKRVVVWGTSWGGYWATKLAVVEKDRLVGAVNQAGPIDHFFEREWQLKALGTREYLIDLFAARAALYGVNTLDDFLAECSKMSLAKLGIIDRPSTPMLLVNGAKDTQVPIADLTLLLVHGSVKDAWVNPQTGHVGPGPGWSADRISDEVVMPWIARRFARSE